MIMGNKIVKVEDALITIGGFILSILKSKTLSLDELYFLLNEKYPKKISFEKFIYTVDFLYMINKIEIYKDDILRLKK